MFDKATFLAIFARALCCFLVETPHPYPTLQWRELGLRRGAARYFPLMSQGMFAISGFQLEGEPYRTPRHRYYRAERLSDGARVLLKTGLEDTPPSMVAEALQGEFEMLQRVQNPHITEPLSLERDGDNVALVIRDLGGRPLPDHLTRPLTTAQFLSIAIPLTEGLQAIHAAGIIHKDLHPDCILLGPREDSLQVGGLDSAIEQTREVPTLLYPSSISQNLEWLAPEQTGLQNQLVDLRADLYSLGIIFYQLLSGTVPFLDEDPRALSLAHVRKAPALLTAATPGNPIPKQLVGIVMRLIQKRADDRYQSAAALLQDLQQVSTNIREGKETRGFPLGRLDARGGRLRLHSKLYERDKQIKTLNNAFQHAVHGDRILCVITGEAGTGKTMLARELAGSVAAAGGYFAAGAFDPLGAHTPYAVFMRAFSDLVSQILTEPRDRLEVWERNLKEEVGRHRAVISELVPELEILLGALKASQSLNPVNTQNRFNQAFVSFIRAFAKPEHPLVLFLDNMQWLDTASQSFLELILAHPEIHNVMIIAAIRTEDYSADHPMRQVVDDLTREKVAMQAIDLLPLSPDGVELMLSESLLPPKEIADPSVRALDTIHELGNLLTVATQGNPYFIREFLTNLQERQRLVQKMEGDVMEWRLERIRPEDVAKSVEPLIALRMQRLPEATRALLQIAASVNWEFELSTLVYVCEMPQKRVIATLQPAVDQGFLIYAGKRALLNPLSESERNFTGNSTPVYQFVQNLVQLTAYELAGVDERRLRHLRMGRLFMADLSTAEREAHIYTVLRHLNESRGLVVEASENVTLTELNLTAAQKAKSCLAYGVALDYATVAFTTFDKSWWTKRYKLTHALYRERAELEYLHGNQAGGEDFVQVALKNTRNALEKAELYTMQVTQLTAIGENEKAIKIGCQALKELGQSVVNPLRSASGTWLSWKLRQAALKLSLRASFFRSRLNMRGRNLEALQKIEPMTKPDKRATLQLLAETLVPAYYTHRDLWFLLATRVINLTMANGIAGEAAPGFAAYGVLSNRLRKERRLGYDFGLFAERLSRKFNNRAMQCQACFLLASHLQPWVRPLRELETLLDSGHSASIEAGELHYGSAILINKITLAFFRNLDPEETQERLDLLEHFSHMMQSPRPLVLTGFEILLSEVTGTYGDDRHSIDRQVQDFINKCYEAREIATLGLFLVLRAMNLQWMGFSTAALEHLREAKAFSAGLEGTLLEAYAALTEVCAIADAFREATHSQKGKYRVRLNELTPRLKVLAAECPDNFQPFFHLARAAQLRLEGSTLEAIEVCERAATTAQSEGLHAVEGYAAESAATLALRRGNALMASAYASQALRAYRRWASPVKLLVFEREFGELIHNFGVPDRVEESSPTLELDTPDPDSELSGLPGVKMEAHLQGSSVKGSPAPVAA